MTIKEAKTLDLVDYLSRLGYEGETKDRVNYWYCSPLPDRSEKTPSFCVNRKKNEWKDWGDGRWGTIIDFGILYHGCTVKQFLEILSTSAPAISRPAVSQSTQSPVEEPRKITVVSVKDITSLPLIKYYRSRKIPRHIAEQYLKEVTYRLGDKKYYALGFKSDAGGYELRNQHIKAATKPKGTTFIDNGARELAVFEGSFDFLSYLAVHDNMDVPRRNFLILNSTSFFEQSIGRMMDHEHTYLYLDNNPTGDKCTALAIAASAGRFSDERSLYKNHEDFNAWLQNFGTPPAQRTQLKL